MSHPDCEHLVLLALLLGQNRSAWDEAIRECEGDSPANASTLTSHPIDTFQLYNLLEGDLENGNNPTQDGQRVFAYLTPFIILVGLVGNAVSLRVFASSKLRKLAASLYLAAISISDSLVLLINVFLQWLDKGLLYWPGGNRISVVNTEGVCQSFLFFSYMLRFTSAWLIVIFTVERYIAACRPLQRRIICSKTFGRKAIVGSLLIGSLVSIYKPVLSGIFPATLPPDFSNGFTMDANMTDTFGLATEDILHQQQSPPATVIYVCAMNPEYTYLNFPLELAYGLLITAVPFIVIAVFNTLILKTIMHRNATIRKWRLSFRENRIRWEFTVTLLVVSSAFVCLNIPYFIFWIQMFLRSGRGMVDTARFKHLELYTTKTIFSLNYCINFFFYCVTGTYYRRELKRIFCCKTPVDPYHSLRKRSSSCATALTSFKEVSHV